MKVNDTTEPFSTITSVACSRVNLCQVFAEVRAGKLFCADREGVWFVDHFEALRSDDFVEGYKIIRGRLQPGIGRNALDRDYDGGVHRVSSGFRRPLEDPEENLGLPAVGCVLARVVLAHLGGTIHPAEGNFVDEAEDGIVVEAGADRWRRLGGRQLLARTRGRIRRLRPNNAHSEEQRSDGSIAAEASLEIDLHFL